MYIYFTQLHHHVSDSAMSMARTRTALPYWMSLKNVMLWRGGERTRWMPWFVQWYATVLLSMVIIYTSLSCHHSCHQTKETVPTEIAYHWLLNDFFSLLTFVPVCLFFQIYFSETFIIFIIILVIICWEFLLFWNFIFIEWPYSLWKTENGQWKENDAS